MLTMTNIINSSIFSATVKGQLKTRNTLDNHRSPVLRYNFIYRYFNVKFYVRCFGRERHIFAVASDFRFSSTIVRLKQFMYRYSAKYNITYKNKVKMFDYYLSYLLKYTLVNGEFTTQSQLSAKIRKAYYALSNKNDILETSHDESETNIVGYTTRIGLNAKDSDASKEKNKKSYASLELAIAKNFDKTYVVEKKLPRIESLAYSFLSTYDSDKEKWCKDHLGYQLKI